MPTPQPNPAPKAHGAHTGRSPKHRTPNYRLVTYTDTARPWLPKRLRTFSTWEPMPLRADRKDL